MVTAIFPVQNKFELWINPFNAVFSEEHKKAKKRHDTESETNDISDSMQIINMEKKLNFGYYIVYQKDDKFEDFIDWEEYTKKENECLDVIDNKNKIAWGILS